MFTYFLKNRLRDKSFVFWSMMFPILLMLCFKIAFGNLVPENIETLNVAVISSECTQSFKQNFEVLIDELEKEDSNGDSALLSEKAYNLEQEAQEALNQGEIDLIFKLENDEVEVLFPSEHTTASIAIGRSIAMTYMQNYSLIEAAFEKDPASAMTLVNNLGENIDFVTSQKSDFVDDDPNPYLWYFYSSFIMGIFFNALVGVELVGDLKADVAYTGMRISLSPAKKSKLIIAAYSSSILIALCINVMQLLIMKYVFNISLGDDMLKLALLVVSCNVFTLSFGVLCGCFLKGTVDQRSNKATSIIMASVFLSGEMVSQLPGFIERKCPIINDINPATIMNMALFRLCYSTGDFDFYSNLTKIIVIGLICLVVSVLLLRREKYASV